MADISQEIDQLRNAVYGEEVRGAFISCMQKIHEENESYNSIKESVNQSAATMQEQVESINTKSEEVKAALQNLTIAMPLWQGTKKIKHTSYGQKRKICHIAPVSRRGFFFYCGASP